MAPTKESTTEAEITKDVVTEILSEASTEKLTDIITTSLDWESLRVHATKSNTNYENPDMMTYDQWYDETTTAEIATENQNKHGSVDHTATTEYTNLFDSRNSFNQIMGSIKDAPSLEWVHKVSKSP